MYKNGDIIRSTVDRNFFLIELYDPDEDLYYVMGLNNQRYRGPITGRYANNYCAWVA